MVANSTGEPSRQPSQQQQQQEQQQQNSSISTMAPNNIPISATERAGLAQALQELARGERAMQKLENELGAFEAKLEQLLASFDGILDGNDAGPAEAGEEETAGAEKATDEDALEDAAAVEEAPAAESAAATEAKAEAGVGEGSDGLSKAEAQQEQHNETEPATTQDESVADDAAKAANGSTDDTKEDAALPSKDEVEASKAEEAGAGAGAEAGAEKEEVGGESDAAKGEGGSGAKAEAEAKAEEETMAEKETEIGEEPEKEEAEKEKESETEQDAAAAAETATESTTSAKSEPEVKGPPAALVEDAHDGDEQAAVGGDSKALSDVGGGV